MASEEEELNDFYLDIEENRLKTFKDWPFDAGDNCTPAKMAAAGFYHCPTKNEPDLVKCFLCYKELDGWEPTDDPWEEHKSHSSKCPFLNKKNHQDQITIAAFLKLEAVRQVNRLNKHIEEKTKEFKHYASETRKQMESLVQCD